MLQKVFPKILIIFLIILVLIPVFLYFMVFHSGLDQTHTRWGEFGSFLSPIVSILAFIGILYSIEITKDQFKKQSEESGFFNLLNLHINKVNQFTGGPNQEMKGVEAFRFYADEFKTIYNEHCIDYARFAMADNTDKLPDIAYEFLYKKITGKDCLFVGEDEIRVVLNHFTRFNKDRLEGFKVLVNVESLSPEDRDTLQGVGAIVFEDSNPEWRLKKLLIIYDFFYNRYGHKFGHYFRNMYYILKYADETNLGKYFARIYRAQLSRYELAILFYNIMGRYTSRDFNRLIFNYNMLDDLYGLDLCYTAHDTRLNADLNTLKMKNS